MRHRHRSERTRCRELVEKSLAMVTALAPLIGCDAGASIAHEAVASGKMVREVAQLKNLLTPEQLERALEPWSMTMPGREKQQ
jgi:fumarate hydratase, class II